MILLCLLLTGCQTKTITLNNADAATYQSFYQDLYQQTDFASESSYFEIHTEMAAAGSGTYAYAVIIDDPSIAMYNIRALVLDDDLSYEDNSKMMPSSGIIDTSYSMIPHQVNKEEGYVRGIALRGSVEESSIEIRLLVEWLTEDNETMREYFRWQLDESGAVPIRS